MQELRMDLSSLVQHCLFCGMSQPPHTLLKSSRCVRMEKSQSSILPCFIRFLEQTHASSARALGPTTYSCSMFSFGSAQDHSRTTDSRTPSKQTLWFFLKALVNKPTDKSSLDLHKKLINWPNVKYVLTVSFPTRADTKINGKLNLQRCVELLLHISPSLRLWCP